MGWSFSHFFLIEHKRKFSHRDDLGLSAAQLQHRDGSENFKTEIWAFCIRNSSLVDACAMVKRAKASRLCHLKRAETVPQIIIGEIFSFSLQKNSTLLGRRIITFLARYGNYFAQSAKIRLLFLLDFPPVKKEKNWAKESEIDRGGNNIIAKWIKSRLNELTTLRWAFRPRKGLQPGFAVEFCVVFFPNTSACTQHGGFALLIQLCKIRLEIYPKNSTLLRRELECMRRKKSKSDFYKIPHSIVAAAAVVELFCVMLIFFLLSQP